VFTSAVDRTPLGLTGLVTKDQQKFVTSACASYIATQAEPYPPTLAADSYTKATIDAALATLDAMTTAIEARKSAFGVATQATADREAAFAAMNDWVAQYCTIAKVAKHRAAQVMVRATVGCRPATLPLWAGRETLRPAQGWLARHPLPHQTPTVNCINARIRPQSWEKRA
jgi:hypothetical protein